MATQFFMFAGWACAAIGVGLAVRAHIALKAEREFANNMERARIVLHNAMWSIAMRTTPRAKGAERDMSNLAKKAIKEQAEALLGSTAASEGGAA